MSLDVVSFIAAKKAGRAHAREHIEEFVRSAVSGDIPDYQIAAWLMAVCFQGLSFKETLALTQAMARSGRVYEWDSSGPPVVDKHSTGGVGDTVTLIVAPIVAAMGMRMGKHSGRGLGHTGGTIDKLESIPGFRTSLSEKEFRNIVNEVGCAVAGQDKDMTPADGLFYGLRDVTATVRQESLIASSVMAKKLAGGASFILLDVKVGSGAFMKDLNEAMKLASLMVRIGKNAGRSVHALLTSMDAPLGRAVGNALEVREAIHVLKDEVPPDDPLRLACVETAARLGSMCGLGDMRAMRRKAAQVLHDGSALQRFRRMIKLQGGNPSVVDEPVEILPKASRIFEFKSTRNAFVKSCDALEIGELVRDLGAGRKSKTDTIDPSVGIVFHKRPGDSVSKGQLICEVHTNSRLDDSTVSERLRRAIRFCAEKPVTPPLFLKR